MRQPAELFKALADDTRLRILSLLSGNELCVCEITRVLGIAQPKVSRHLAVLRQAGLVSDRRNGTWVYYSLAPAGSETHRWILDWLASAPRAFAQAAADRRTLQRLRAQGGLCGPSRGVARRPAPRVEAVAAE